MSKLALILLATAGGGIVLVGVAVLLNALKWLAILALGIGLWYGWRRLRKS